MTIAIRPPLQKFFKVGASVSHYLLHIENCFIIYEKCVIYLSFFLKNKRVFLSTLKEFTDDLHPCTIKETDMS